MENKSIADELSELTEQDWKDYAPSEEEIENAIAETMALLEPQLGFSCEIKQNARIRIYVITRNGTEMGRLTWNPLERFNFGVSSVSDDGTLGMIANRIKDEIGCEILFRKSRGESKAQPTANQTPTMQSPAPTAASKTTKWLVKAVPIALPILGVAIALTTNVASNALPEEWKPYLWLSWPLLLVLLVISVILIRWQGTKTQT